MSAALFASSPQSCADESVWVEMIPDVIPVVQARSSSEPAPTPQLEKYRLFSLDEQRLEEQLSMVSAARSAVPGSPSGIVVSLPLPDGSFAEVEVVPERVLSPEQESLHPELKAWTVVSSDSRIASGVVDMTPNGFHAMLMLTNGDTVFIDPQGRGDSRRYASFSKQSNANTFAQRFRAS